MDILAKPWQRLTKYSLLLKAILKKTEPPEEQATLRQMVSTYHPPPPALRLGPDMFGHVWLALTCRYRRVT